MATRVGLEPRITMENKSITVYLPRLGKRKLFCLLLFACNYVVSVWRDFLFAWDGLRYFILALPEPFI